MIQKTRIKTLENKLKSRPRDMFRYCLSGRWNYPHNLRDLYTIILPAVPKLYPVTEYNLRFLTSCDLQHCSEIIVVSHDKSFYGENVAITDSYSNRIRVRYVVLPLLTRVLLKPFKSAYYIHPANLVAGIKNSATKYVFFHDTDYFITDKYHIEHMFVRAREEHLDLVSTYSRSYSDIAVTTPAVYELLARREYLTSQPPYFMFSNVVSNIDYSTFVRLYCAAPAKEVFLNREDGEVGIHFKHLLAGTTDIKGKFLDSAFSLFLLFALCGSNHCSKVDVFRDIDDYFEAITGSSHTHFVTFKSSFLRFVESPPLRKEERQLLLLYLDRLEQRVKTA